MIYSPSKHCPTAFLKYLRENNYISKRGKEFSKIEVDNMYFQKLNDHAFVKTEKHYNNLLKDYETRNY